MTLNNPILFLGDSLTEWFDYEHYFPGKKISNHGIVGDTSSGIIHRLDEVVLEKPEKIFLMIGVNDLFHRIEKETVSINHERIIEILVKGLPETQLLIQSLLPVNEDMLFSMKLNNTILWLNNRLSGFCIEQNLRFVNLFDHFISNGQLKPEYTTDGGHLSQSGYIKWANLIRLFL